MPPSDADQLLKLQPAVQPVKPTLESAASLTASNNEDQMDPSLQQVIETTREYAEKDDPSLQRALAMSLKDKEEALLQTALELSMQGKFSWFFLLFDVLIAVFDTEKEFCNVYFSLVPFVCFDLEISELVTKILFLTCPQL